MGAYMPHYDGHRLQQKILRNPKIHFLALFHTLQHACFAQNFQVMRHRRTRQRGHRDNLPYIQPLTRFKSEQDALPVFVAQCGEHLGNIAPLFRYRAHVIFIHVYIINYLVMYVKPVFDTKREDNLFILF